MKNYKKLKPNEIRLRDHTYDGIEEYDQRLPNWWLVVLYGGILFSIGYWIYFFKTDLPKNDEQVLEQALLAIETQKLKNLAEVPDDATFWKMSRNEEFVQLGKAAFQNKCVVCHGQNLEGGIGLNLADNTWKYGGNPSDVYKIIYEGSPDKTAGMQAWSNELQQNEIIDLVAFVMSHHRPPQE